MAEPRVQYSPRQNSPPASKNDLARAAPGAPTNDSSPLSHTPTVSRVPTPALAPLLAAAKPVARYTDTNL